MKKKANIYTVLFFSKKYIFLVLEGDFSKVISLDDVFSFLENKIKNNFGQKNLIQNFLSIAKYIVRIIKEEFGVILPIKKMKAKDKLGEYNGNCILVNESVYESKYEKDILSASRNVLHEIVHVYSDFYDLFLRNKGQKKNFSDVFIARINSMFVPKCFFKQGIAITNAMKCRPKNCQYLKHYEIVGSSKLGYIHFDSLILKIEFLQKFKDIFNIPQKERHNFLEEMLTYGLCGNNNKNGGIIYSILMNEEKELLSAKLQKFSLSLFEENKEASNENYNFSESEKILFVHCFKEFFERLFIFFLQQ